MVRCTFALSEAPDQQLRMHDLAAEIVLCRSNLTRLIDRLEAAGLVCRKSCFTDRRGAFAAITEQGLTMRQKTWPIYEQAITKYFACCLDDTEVEIFTKVLQKMLACTRQGLRAKMPLLSVSNKKTSAMVLRIRHQGAFNPLGDSA